MISVNLAVRNQAAEARRQSRDTIEAKRAGLSRIVLTLMRLTGAASELFDGCSVRDLGALIFETRQG